MTDISKKINVLYHLWHNGEPVPNGYKNVDEYQNDPDVYAHPWISRHTRIFRSLIHEYDVNTMPKNEPVFFLVWTPNWKHGINRYPYIPDEILHAMQHSNTYLVLYQPEELIEYGFSTAQDQRRDTIRQTFSKLAIPKEKKIIITGNLSAYSGVDRGDFWEYGLDIFKYTLQLSDTPRVPFNLSKIRPKKWLILGGRERQHRIYAAWKLWNYRHNYHMSQQIEGNPGEQYNQYIDYDLQYKDNWYHNFPLTLENDNYEDNQPFILDKRFIEETYFNLVLETYCEVWTDEIQEFVTEKTYKPLLWFQPFVILSRPGALKNLQSLGFQTFPELFDESYDTILDTKKRMDAALKEVIKYSQYSNEQLLDVYKSVADKLQYNHDQLLGYDKNCWKAEIKNTFYRITQTK